MSIYLVNQAFSCVVVMHGFKRRHPDNPAVLLIKTGILKTMGGSIMITLGHCVIHGDE